MLRLVAIASLLIGCRISLENESMTDASTQACLVNTQSPTCVEAVNHRDLAWIEQNIFAFSCNFGPGLSCHASASASGKLDLNPGASRGHLVGVSSMVDATRRLVVPNDVAASYLMLMVRDVPPAMANPPANPPPGNIGFMPQNSTPLCCQKLQALERWINDGAPNN